MNFKNLIYINIDSIESLLTGKNKGGSLKVIDECQIRGNPNIGHIITTTESKDYKIVFDKRVIRNGLNTYPFGM